MLEGQKGDQGGGAKNSQNSIWGKTGHLKRAAQKRPTFWVGKISTFWASSSAKKVLLTAEKVGVGPNLTKISGGVKHGHL